jgi:hypothetical protein
MESVDTLNGSITVERLNALEHIQNQKVITAMETTINTVRIERFLQPFALLRADRTSREKKHSCI